ncbi:MAG: ABC transporter ATP-binding protein [Atribacterota bacterium]
MLELKGLRKSFGDIKAVDNFHLSVDNGEFFVLLGPTGAGKTTTLRMTVGLEDPDEGDIFYDNNKITELPPAVRNFAFMFESHNLYPVLNVYDNLAFPLRSPLFKTPEGEIKKRVEKVANDIHMTHLLKRKVSNLSGGEQQRVALGRTLVRKPNIYVLDEPISSLDYKLREELQTEFKRIHEEYGITIFSATHDNVSAMAMATRIGIMYEGRLLQTGPPREIYTHPVSMTVANIIGAPSMNFVDCVIDNHDHLYFTSDPTLFLPVSPETVRKVKSQQKKETNHLFIGVWPEDVGVVEDEKTGFFPCQVDTIEYHGAEKFVNFTFQNSSIKALISHGSQVKHGDAIFIFFPEDKLYYFDPESEERIG